jgi:hypothetical protein
LTEVHVARHLTVLLWLGFLFGVFEVVPVDFDVSSGFVVFGEVFPESGLFLLEMDDD